MAHVVVGSSITVNYNKPKILKDLVRVLVDRLSRRNFTLMTDEQIHDLDF